MSCTEILLYCSYRENVFRKQRKVFRHEIRTFETKDVKKSKKLYVFSPKHLCVLIVGNIVVI